jgi:glyoxylase I family protein
MPEFPAITQVALAPSDLSRSRPWYQRLLAPDPVIDGDDAGPFHHVVCFIGGTSVGIHQFPDLKSAEPFDDRRPGLDHLAFACAKPVRPRSVRARCERVQHRQRRDR